VDLDSDSDSDIAGLVTSLPILPSTSRSRRLRCLASDPLVLRLISTLRARAALSLARLQLL